MSEKPSRRRIVQELRNKERHPVSDADKFQRMKDVPEAFEAVHHGRDGSITLVYELEKAIESTTAGQVADFDLMEENDA